MKDIKIFNEIKEEIKPNDFMNYECIELAKFIFSYYENNEKFDLKELISFFDNREDIDYKKIEEILNQNINISDENMHIVIEDLIGTIKESKLKQRRNEIIKEIKKLDTKKDKDERDVERFEKLCMELLEIDREMK